MNCAWPIAPAHDPFSLRQVDVAAIEDLERVEQLAAEERRAARIPRERRERRDGRAHAAEAAEVRLHAPDGDDDPRRHAVALADLVEQLALRRERRRGRARIRFGVRMRAMYFSREKTVSACARSRSRMTGCGSVTSASASSTTSSRTPRAIASARTPASHSANDGRAGSCPSARASVQRDQHDSSATEPGGKAPCRGTTQCRHFGRTRGAPTTIRSYCELRDSSFSAPPRPGRRASAASSAAPAG